MSNLSRYIKHMYSCQVRCCLRHLTMVQNYESIFSCQSFRIYFKSLPLASTSYIILIRRNFIQLSLKLMVSKIWNLNAIFCIFALFLLKKFINRFLAKLIQPSMNTFQHLKTFPTIFCIQSIPIPPSILTFHPSYSQFYPLPPFSRAE